MTYDSIPVWIRWLCWISHLYCELVVHPCCAARTCWPAGCVRRVGGSISTAHQRFAAVGSASHLPPALLHSASADAFMGLTINNFRGQSEWSCTTPATPDCTARSGDAILTRHALRQSTALLCPCRSHSATQCDAEIFETARV